MVSRLFGDDSDDEEYEKDKENIDNETKKILIAGGIYAVLFGIVWFYFIQK